MKLFKPSYSYGTNQRNFSDHEYQEQMSQFNYAKYECDKKPNLSNYNIKAQEYSLGQSFGDYDANESSQDWANESINAQRGQPSSSINLQKTHHAHMKRQESQMGQDFAANFPKCSKPALLDHSSHKMGQAWTTKPNQFSSPDLAHNFAEYMSKGRDEEAYGYCEDGSDMFSTPNYLSPIKTNQIAHKNGTILNFSSPTQAQHSALKMTSNTNSNWANSPTKFYSPTQQSQRKEHHDLGYSNTIQAHNFVEPDILSTPNYLSPIKTNQIAHKNEHKTGTISNFSSQTQAQHPALKMTSNMDSNWANSPTKFYNSTQAQQSQRKEHHDLGYSNPIQAHESEIAMHKEDYMMRKVNHGLSNSTTKFPSPTPSQAHHATMAMDYGWASSPTKSNQGWANSEAHYSGPDHLNSSSSNTSKQRHVNNVSNDVYVDEDVLEIMDEILAKYPAHNISGGHGSSWAAKPNSCAFGGSGPAQHMNAGYLSNSRANKFETNSLINKGRFYDEMDNPHPFVFDYSCDPFDYRV